jgi:hypothetical protein
MAAPSAMSAADAAGPARSGHRLVAPPRRLDEPHSALVPGLDRAQQAQRGPLLAVSLGQQHGGPQPARFLLHALERAGHHRLGLGPDRPGVGQVAGLQPQQAQAAPAGREPGMVTGRTVDLGRGPEPPLGAGQVVVRQRRDAQEQVRLGGAELLALRGEGVEGLLQDVPAAGLARADPVQAEQVQPPSQAALVAGRALDIRALLHPRQGQRIVTPPEGERGRLPQDIGAQVTVRPPERRLQPGAALVDRTVGQPERRQRERQLGAGLPGLPPPAPPVPAPGRRRAPRTSRRRAGVPRRPSPAGSSRCRPARAASAAWPGRAGVPPRPARAGGR